MNVGSLIDIIVQQLQAKIPYGRIVKKPNGSIAIQMDSNGLKRLLIEASARSNPNRRADIEMMMRFMNIEIKNGFIEISIKLI